MLPGDPTHWGVERRRTGPYIYNWLINPMNTTVLSYKYHKPYVIGVVCTNLAIVPGHCKKEDVSTASAVSSPKVRMRPLKLGIYKNVFLQVMHQLSTREMRSMGFPRPQLLVRQNSMPSKKCVGFKKISLPKSVVPSDQIVTHTTTIWWHSIFRKTVLLKLAIWRNQFLTPSSAILGVCNSRVDGLKWQD